MADKKIKWTEQQRRAIAARGSDVLVTASAGTGKTAVLSGRCVDIVRDKTVCPDVFSMLVLTFTEMAAEQMRSRIAGQLRTAFLENRDPHLRHQLVLLQGADISTIHSFCKRLITEYFYKLALDPTFRVIDADEARLLKAEVLEKTIDWAWEQSNLVPALQQLLSRRDLRTNDGFLAKVIDLSDFLDTVVSRENWYERAARLAEAANPFTTELGEKQKQIIAEKFQYILNQLQYARNLYQNENPDGDWGPECEDTFIKPILQCVELLKAGDWDRCAEKIRNFEKPRVNKPKEIAKTLAELIQRTVKKAVDSFEKLSELAVVNPEYLDRVGRAASLQTKVLVELVKKFDRLYSDAKRAINCLDFADLEHYALKLLTEQDSSGDELTPSETALALRRRYKYIFVDEYQDINPVQQAILDMLSSGGNVFVVGDVKQSIYAWRGAEPEIFIKRLMPASVDSAKTANGLRVDLNANFRSAKGILDFVNTIFRRIMTASFAKIDYDESAKLRPAIKDEAKAQAPADSKPMVEFHILDEMDSDKDSGKEQSSQVAGEEEINIISSRQRQAAMIAERIRQMVGAQTGKPEFQVYDKEQQCLRNVEYRDIVVLMRSLAKKANDYVEVFQLAGVPVSCQATAGYFEATEITDILSLLKVLDNPQRDIELAAVLRSPFFKISDTELATIKIHSKTNEEHTSFYNCVRRYCACGPDAKLAERLNKILDTIEQWRTLARRGNLADLIWQIYRQTGFLSFVSALANGQARRANLLKLHDRAIQFEGFASSAGGVSLGRFVEFIEKLQEVGQDWAPAEPEAAAGNAVRILSVHKSKGLEFPVVFLAELSSRFNKQDVYGDMLADSVNTVGLQIIDRESNSKLRSLAYQVIAERKLSQSLAEEMRILYVATTRARERLILTACGKEKHCRDIICNGFYFGGGPVADWQLHQCRSPLEWVLYGLSDQRNLHNVFETGLQKKAIDDDLFSLKLYGQTELRQLCRYVLKLKRTKSSMPAPLICHSEHSAPPICHSERSASGAKNLPKRAQSKLFSQVKKSFAWRYAFGDAPVLAAKQSVTELTHRSNEYAGVDYSGALDRWPVAAAETGLAGPVEGRLIGTATHLVIAQLDLVGPVNKGAIEKTKEKLLAEGAITEAVAEHIDTDSIMGFFESKLGQVALDTENTLWREWLFTFALPACELGDTMDGRWGMSGGSLKAPRLRGDKLAPAEAGGFGDGQSRYATYEIRDTIIVQGIIDMLIQTPRGLVVIDFKTDDVTHGGVAERAE
ncbi:MAG TPA: helicase-exonuclease AddAB subunit AddA, partial [Sedimentisphaerales bacterium]|nr:helicase-exonuclease AddAB subunit AddA [Sedimentisphaerales bacterium]